MATRSVTCTSESRAAFLANMSCFVDLVLGGSQLDEHLHGGSGGWACCSFCLQQRSSGASDGLQALPQSIALPQAGQQLPHGLADRGHLQSHKLHRPAAQGASEASWTPASGLWHSRWRGMLLEREARCKRSVACAAAKEHCKGVRECWQADAGLGAHLIFPSGCLKLEVALPRSAPQSLGLSCVPGCQLL